MKSVYISLLILLAPCMLIAAEVDSFTPRELELEDSANDINTIINQRIREGVAKANADRRIVEDVEGIELITRRDDCDVDDLYTSLRKSIFQSYTASWGLKGYDLDLQFRKLLSQKTYALPLRDSIYRDIDYLEGFSLNLKELTHVVNIGSNLVGLDKIGHFFAEGWQYFEIGEEEDGGLGEAIVWGRGKEEGMFGTTTTGIFSYADMVANFNGWRFWNRVLLEEPDPLNSFVERLFDRAYVSCDIQVIESLRQLRVVRAWEVNRRFDLRDYIDGTWDEGNNCNSYADPVIEEKVENRIAEIYPGYSCPLNIEACIEARDRYGIYAHAILHPACLETKD